MSPERRTTKLWTAHLDAELPSHERQLYGGVVSELARIPMESRYQMMAIGPHACFQAVDFWKRLGVLFDGVQFGDQWAIFDRPVINAYGTQEHGQDLLKIALPDSPNILVADVAGYLYGFPYDEMFVAAGSIEYLSEMASQHYARKYPELAVQFVGKRVRSSS